MIKKIFFILLCILSSQFVSAQADDTLRTKDSTLYSINHASTGILNYTNASKSYLLNNLLKFNIIRKRISINTTNGYIYGRQQTGVTNNDFTSNVDVSLFKAVQRLYYWGIVTYDKSYSLKINDRIQSGSGIGFTIFAKPALNIVLSDGILYDYSSLEDTSYSTMRNSFRLKYRVTIGKIVTLDGINFLQQSFVSSEDYILKLNNNISFRLKNWLSFTVATTYNKLNISNTENFLCTAGLTFQKTFTTVSK